MRWYLRDPHSRAQVRQEINQKNYINRSDAKARKNIQYLKLKYEIEYMRSFNISIHWQKLQSWIIREIAGDQQHSFEHHARSVV